MHPNDSIPYGYCHCGCGEKTKLVTQNNAPRGLVKGEPYQYLKGHHRRKPVVDGKTLCSRCGIMKPLDAFTKHRKQRLGVASWCLSCVNEDSRRFRTENPDRAKEFGRRYRRNNRTKTRERMRLYHQRTKEACRSRLRAWRRNNPDKYRATKIRRRALEMGAVGYFTDGEWASLKSACDYRCVRCGRREPEIELTVDHVVPLSRGGGNGIDNIQPLCMPCNSQKATSIADYRPRRLAPSPDRQLSLFGDT